MSSRSLSSWRPFVFPFFSFWAAFLFAFSATLAFFSACFAFLSFPMSRGRDSVFVLHSWVPPRRPADKASLHSSHQFTNTSEALYASKWGHNLGLFKLSFRR